MTEIYTLGVVNVVLQTSVFCNNKKICYTILHNNVYN